MRVLTKSWDVLAAEYGLNFLGDIQSRPMLPCDMMEHFPLDKEIITDVDGSIYFEYDRGRRFYISAKMIDRTITKENTPEYFL